MIDYEKNGISYIKKVLLGTAIPDAIPEEFLDSKEMKDIDETIRSIRTSMHAIGNGDLSTKIQGSGHTIGVIKNLQATLKTLTWQTKRIAEGDFSQRTDFLGEFSKAFNTMTIKLEKSIQEVKDTKELFEMVFTTIPDATMIISLEQGKLFDFNKAFCQLVKYSKTDLLNKTMVDIGFFKETLQENAWYQELRKNNQCYNTKINIVSKENNLIIGLFSSKIIYIDDVAYIISVIKDITELHKIEEKLILSEIKYRLLAKEMKALSETDKLTQIYNRVKLDEVLYNELERIGRSTNPIALMIIDIDDFKKVNDQFGHQVGDSVLIEFANILSQNIRELDILGRWGGEEFMIILPFTDLDGSYIIAEKLRKSIANNDFVGVGHLTASFGIAATKESTTPDQLASKADKALYEAKHLGKNRVCSYSLY